MREDQTQLWTIHPSDFSITMGRVDHSKSAYYMNTPGVKEAYHELWSRLDVTDGQVVWCYTNEDDIPITGVEKVKWDLHLPSSAVLRYIDDLVWNRILGIRCPVRSDMQHQWRREALKKHPNDPKASKAYEKDCVESFWNQKPESGGWWDELFVDNTGEGVSALIKHPVPIQWVDQCITIPSRRRRIRGTGKLSVIRKPYKQ